MLESDLLLRVSSAVSVHSCCSYWQIWTINVSVNLLCRRLTGNETPGIQLAVWKKNQHEETELLIKIPSVKESLELCLTCVSTVSTGVLRGNDGPQQLLCDVGMAEVTAHTLELL